MSLREGTRPGLGIIEPYLPSPAKAPPSGPGRLYLSPGPLRAEEDWGNHKAR
jgi:hypothetical protein